MNRRWLISRANPEYVNYISKTASVSPILAQILIKRGIRTAGDISSFLNPGLSGLSNPFDLPDMDVAVERIKSAFIRNERVLVHGDYDADGLTAAAILMHALKGMDIDVHFFIPNRLVHGYGFNPPAVEMAKKLGVGLIITVDCGITSFEAAARAKKEGIDVIITDHHEPVKKSEVRSQKSEVEDEFELPDALAVINPKITDHDSRLPTGQAGVTNLSGAGVAFKFAQAMAADNALPFSAYDCLSLLDLAAVGTIADVVPLTGENRILMKEGLKYINNSCRPGIRSLIEVSGLREREIKAGILSFTLVPRINASGRIGDVRDVMNLFLSDSEDEAFSIAEKLDRINTERQKIEEYTYQEALLMLNEKGFDAVIVLSGKGWHAGVVGIVASRIAEEFCRPAFVFAIEDNVAKGSARSIRGLDVYKGLSSCSDLLLSFGGHKQAAGVRLKETNIPFFEEKMNEIVKASLPEEGFTPTIEIDAEIALSGINTGLVRELALLEPFGFGNPEPLLGTRGIDILHPRIVGKNHLKMRVRQGTMSIDAIGFDMGKFLDTLSSSTSVDAAFTPTINDWNGGRHLQLNLKACRPSHR